jgi:peptidoglycan/LPS O-acetylase OafA/YrhL
MPDQAVETRRAEDQLKAGERFRGADGIRALACLGVFICHIQFYWPVPEGHGLSAIAHKFIGAGDRGVAMFFVLSGFLLSMPFWRAHRAGRGMPDLKVYAIRRLARIAPGYWLCVLVTAAIYGAWHTRWDQIALLLTLGFGNSLLSATYLPRFDGPLWSISVEMIFYALLPLVALGMFRLRKAWAARAYCVAVIGLLALGQSLFLRAAPAIERYVNDPAWFRAKAQSWATHQNAAVLFTHFVVGMLAADLYLVIAAAESGAGAGRRGVERRFNRYDLAAGAALLVMLWGALDPSRDLPQVQFLRYHFPTMHVLVGLCLATLPFSRVLGAWVDNRIMRGVAALSFGIYMWHDPILIWLDKLLKHRLPASYAPNGAYGYVGMGVFAAAALALTCSVAALSYFLVERPIMDYVHRRYRSRPAPRLVQDPVSVVGEQ